ncbi:MAG: carboxypeptidase-like regulatory domain-containing protein [Planctomycetota bacterium]
MRRAPDDGAASHPARWKTWATWVARGVTVQGEVVDASGNPVAKVGVSLDNLPLPIQASMAASNSRSGWTDAEGRFAINEPIPVGTWPLEVQANGYALVEPQQVTIAEQSGPQELRVVVRAQRCLAGVVVDDRGQPVSRIYLKTKSERSGKMEGSWTRSDGTFKIFARDDAPESVQLECHDAGPCQPLTDERFFTWGTTDICIVMKRALVFELTVVEAGTGTPVEDYAVKCHAADASWSNEEQARLGGHHADGKVTVDKVVRGRNVLRIIPQDQALAISDAIEFEAVDGLAAPMRIELSRMVPLVVRLITAADEPIGGSRVELVRGCGEPVTLDDRVEDLRSDAMIISSRPLPLMISKGTTDEAGLVTLYGPAGIADLVIRALGPGHLPVLREPILLPGEESPLEIEVARGSTLRGKLTGDAVRAYRARVKLVPLDGKIVRHDSQALSIGADGSFVAQSLPAGQYHVLLSIEASVRDQGSGSTGHVDLLPPLGVATVESRESEVAFDTSPFNPGSLDARLVLDPTLLKSARVTLHGRGGQLSIHAESFSYEMASEWNLGVFLPDATGAFHAETLPPGEYTLSIALSDGTLVLHQFLESQRSFTIRPGEKTTHVCEIKRQRLRLHVLAADGRPLKNTACEVETGRHGTHTTTDADGWLVLDPAPGAPVRVLVDGHGTSELVTMPDDRSEADIEVKVVSGR